MNGPGEFLPVPAWVLGRSDVSDGAMLLLGCLYGYERKRRQEWPSVSQLVSDMRRPRRTITRWLEELTGIGLVTSEKVGREVHYAPAICAKDGSRRDLSPTEEHGTEMACVVPQHAPNESHITGEHGSGLAHIDDLHLSLKREEISRSDTLSRSESARASGATPCGIVEGAYATALGETKGRYVPNPTGDIGSWRSAVEGVKALAADGARFDAEALRLARAYVAERRTRSPAYFAEWLQKRAASGTSAGYAGPSHNHAAAVTTEAEIEAYDGR